MKHTPGDWYLLEVSGQKFVAAKPTEDHPYFGRARHIDIAGDENYPRKEADLALISQAPAMYETLRDLYDKAPNSFGCRYCGALWRNFETKHFDPCPIPKVQALIRHMEGL